MEPRKHEVQGLEMSRFQVDSSWVPGSRYRWCSAWFICMRGLLKQILKAVPEVRLRIKASDAAGHRWPMAPVQQTNECSYEYIYMYIGMNTNT